MPLPRYSFVIALAPLGVFIATDVVFYKLGWDNPHINGLVLGKPAVIVSYYEAASRYLYLATSLMCIGVAILCVSLFFMELGSRNNDGSRFYKKSTIIEARALFLILFFVATLWFCFSVDEPLYSRIGNDVFTAFFTACFAAEQSKECIFGAIGEGDTLPSGLKLSLRVVAMSSILGAAAAIVGCVLSLSTEHDYADEDSILKRYGVAKTFLYLSSALLTVGILNIMAWIRMPADVIAPNGIHVYMEITKTIGIYFGVSYALIISAFFVRHNLY